MYYAGAFLQFVETTIVAAPSYFYIRIAFLRKKYPSIYLLIIA